MNPEIVEVVARAISNVINSDGESWGLYMSRQETLDLAQAAITAARPAIMEEAAGIVSEWPSQVLTEGEQSERFQSGVQWACVHIATAIRAAVSP